MEDERTSSKAVLAALRALQDKIRRLESERAEAVESARRSKHALRELVASQSASAVSADASVRSAYSRLGADHAALESAHSSTLRRLEAAERTAAESRNDALRQTARADAGEAQTNDALRRCAVAEERAVRFAGEVRDFELAQSLASQAPQLSDARDVADALRQLLDLKLEMRSGRRKSRRAAEDARAAPETEPAKPRRALKMKAAGEPRAAKVVLRRRPSAAAAAREADAGPRRTRPAFKVATPAARRACAAPRLHAPIDAAALPWVPASNQGTSFNLMAAVSYALKRAHDPDQVRALTAIAEAHRRR